MEKRLRIAVPVWKTPPDNYINALTQLGAEAVCVRNMEVSDRNLAGNFDGLLLPGGSDVNPARFHQENRGSEDIDDGRDEMEFTLLDRFVKAGKPVLGICRGHQVINIYFGGTLIQHIAESPRHSRDPDSSQDNIHQVRAVPGSFAEQLYGQEFLVNSAHHQAADQLGAGLCAAAWSDDGLNEALFHESFPVWSVQWHPERLCFAFAREEVPDGAMVLQYFLDQCSRRREQSGGATPADKK